MTCSRAAAVATAVVVAAMTGCSTGPQSRGADVPPAASTAAPGGSASAPAPSTPAPSAPVVAARPAASARPSTAPAALPPYRSSVRPVTAAELGRSWHRGCPVGPDALRALTARYVGFDGRAHDGLIVVAATAVPAVREAFRRLYVARFPVRRIVPTAAYGGSDDAAMADDDTSAFNCRRAVADGPPHWSAHAYGTAVDLDTRENPYLLDGKVLPPQGAPYVDRSRVRPGMVVARGVAVRAFAAVGWRWGGRWSTPDYQHFSLTGG